MNDDNAVFAQSAAIYDLLYSGKSAEKEVEWVVERILKNGARSGASILDLGSGTGRHSTALANSGFSVTGVEPSAEMLARAAHHPATNFLQGDGRTVRLGRSFDVVLAMFHVMSYQVELADSGRFFDTAATHLNPGGIFGFDVWFSPAVHAIQPEPRVLEVASEELSVSRTAVPAEDVLHSLVDVTYNYSVMNLVSGASSEFSETHSMRHFSFSEIELLAVAHGFTIIEAVEFLTENVPSRSTWGVWFLLRKA